MERDAVDGPDVPGLIDLHEALDLDDVVRHGAASTQPRLLKVRPRGPATAKYVPRVPPAGAGRLAGTTLTSIRGVRVGHATDLAHRTGTTVVLVDPPAVAFADHRGGWPGSYDTAASDLGKTFLERHAFFLTGGDIYGYDAAIGIRRFLLERGLAEPSGGGRMPAIMGTNIYDLDFASVEGADFADLGYRACVAASSRPVAQGSLGAGMGATVGPFLEDDPALVGTKGGLGSSAARVGPWAVGALAVSNCVGNVFDSKVGRTIAGAHRRGSRRFVEMDDMLDAYMRGSKARSGTTIAVLGTDAPVDHEQLARIVELAHDGIALAVRP
ncbi:MAG TPA: P1 family peptidase, partial [Thermoplasmata archaeon]|nr:P1 family peptidase [Thermoplasmata archaeon]